MTRGTYASSTARRSETARRQRADSIDQRGPQFEADCYAASIDLEEPIVSACEPDFEGTSRPFVAAIAEIEGLWRV